MADNLEAIDKNTSDDIHSFNPARGLVLRRDAHNSPMVVALACVAESVAVPCCIEDAKVSELEIPKCKHTLHTLRIAVHRGPPTAVRPQQLCGPGCG